MMRFSGFITEEDFNDFSSYLSGEPETCFNELRLPESGVMIASVQIKEPIINIRFNNEIL